MRPSPSPIPPTKRVACTQETTRPYGGSCDNSQGLPIVQPQPSVTTELDHNTQRNDPPALLPSEQPPRSASPADDDDSPARRSWRESERHRPPEQRAHTPEQTSKRSSPSRVASSGTPPRQRTPPPPPAKQPIVARPQERPAQAATPEKLTSSSAPAPARGPHNQAVTAPSMSGKPLATRNAPPQHETSRQAREHAAPRTLRAPPPAHSREIGDITRPNAPDEGSLQHTPSARASGQVTSKVPPTQHRPTPPTHRDPSVTTTKPDLRQLIQPRPAPPPQAPPHPPSQTPPVIALPPTLLAVLTQLAAGLSNHTSPALLSVTAAPLHDAPVARAPLSRLATAPAMATSPAPMATARARIPCMQRRRVVPSASEPSPSSSATADSPTAQNAKAYRTSRRKALRNLKREAKAALTATATPQPQLTPNPIIIIGTDDEQGGASDEADADDDYGPL